MAPIFGPTPNGVAPDYIEDQESHHRRESFEDEFLRLLRKYNVELDERYVWD